MDGGDDADKVCISCSVLLFFLSYFFGFDGYVREFESTVI